MRKVKKSFNKKSIIVLIVILLIAFFVGIGVYLFDNKNPNDNPDDNKNKNQVVTHVDENGELIIMKQGNVNKKFTIDEGKIVISEIRMVDLDDTFELSFLVDNTTDESFPFLKKHYISVFDKDDNVINLVGGEIVGNVAAKGQKLCSITLNNKLSDVYKVMLRKINLE